MLVLFEQNEKGKLPLGPTADWLDDGVWSEALQCWNGVITRRGLNVTASLAVQNNSDAKEKLVLVHGGPSVSYASFMQREHTDYC